MQSPRGKKKRERPRTQAMERPGLGVAHFIKFGLFAGPVRSPPKMAMGHILLAWLIERQCRMTVIAAVRVSKVSR